MDWMVVYRFYAMGWVELSADTGWVEYGDRDGYGYGTDIYPTIFYYYYPQFTGQLEEISFSPLVPQGK